MRVVVAVGAEEVWWKQGGHGVWERPWRRHSGGRCYRSMDDGISVEYFSGYLNLVCTSLYKTRRPAARYVHKVAMCLNLTIRMEWGQALTTTSCVTS